MKSASKLIIAFLAMVFMFSGMGKLFASSTVWPLSIVPTGDKTYVQLAQLEKAGWLPEGSARTPLTDSRSRSEYSMPDRNINK